MSTVLTRMFSECWLYRVINNNLFDSDVYIQRNIYSDLEFMKKGWSGKYKLEVYQQRYDKMGYRVSSDLLFECSNYTKETLSRKFREFLNSRELEIQLIKKEQFFLIK